MTENVIVRPRYDPRKQNPYAKLQKISNHILEYQLFTAENKGVVQVTNLTERRKRCFSSLIDPLKISKLYRISTRLALLHVYSRALFFSS